MKVNVACPWTDTSEISQWVHVRYLVGKRFVVAVDRTPVFYQFITGSATQHIREDLGEGLELGSISEAKKMADTALKELGVYLL